MSRKFFISCAILFLTCYLLVLPASIVYGQISSDASSAITKIKRDLILQKNSALKELSDLEAHLNKIESFISTLNQDKDKDSILISRQAIEKDRSSIDKINARIKETDRMLGLAERAEKYLKNDKNANIDLAVLEVKGDVKIFREGVAREVRMTEDMQIRAGDKIRTGSNSTIVLKTLSGNYIELWPNSEFYVEENNLESSLTDLSMGKIKVKVQRLLKQRFVVRTPTVAVSVRGTEFEVNINESGLTQVQVIEGTVEIQKVIIVKENETWQETK